MQRSRFAPSLRRLASLFTGLALLDAAASAHAQPRAFSDLVGWWRSDLQYNAQEAEMYLHFAEENGKPVVRLSLPFIGHRERASLRCGLRETRVAARTRRGWCWAQPAVAGNRVYAGVAGGPTPVGPRRGAVVALDRATGKVVWDYEVPRSTRRELHRCRFRIFGER